MHTLIAAMAAAAAIVLEAATDHLEEITEPHAPMVAAAEIA